MFSFDSLHIKVLLVKLRIPYSECFLVQGLLPCLHSLTYTGSTSESGDLVMVFFYF